MKYIIALVLGLSVFSTVSADELTGTEFMLNGHKYGGYTGSTIKVGDNVGTKGLVTTAKSEPRIVTGNTRILDIINLLKPEDVQTFISIILKTGLKF